MSTMAEKFVEQYATVWYERGHRYHDWNAAGYRVEYVERHGGIVIGQLETDDRDGVGDGYHMVPAPDRRLLVFIDASFVIDNAPDEITCGVWLDPPSGHTVGGALIRWAKESNEAVGDARAFADEMTREAQRRP